MGFAAALLALAAAASLTPAADAGDRTHLDLDYDPVSSSPLKKLDLYSPVGFSGLRPVVVHIHGGGWRAGDKRNNIADKRDLFTGAGYVFASVNYRLSPYDDPTFRPDRVMFPDHPDDVGQAIGWLGRHVDRYGGDPNRILLVGHSAGAHLVSLVATDRRYIRRHGIEQRRVLGVVALDTAAFDIPRRISELGGAPYLFLNAFGTTEENAATGSWAAASPLRWADRNDPPHLLVTQSARPLRIASNREMALALGEDPGRFVLPVPLDHSGINRALGSPTDSTGLTGRVIAFFGSAVRASRPAKPKLRGRPPRNVRARPGRARVRVRFSVRRGDRAQCAVDRRSFKRCRSPRVFRLAPGNRRIRVRAVGRLADRNVGAPSRQLRLRVRVRR